MTLSLHSVSELVNIYNPGLDPGSSAFAFCSCSGGIPGQSPGHALCCPVPPNLSF